ncbi:hypothetical protein N7462_001921 [Penicillium macrosclerotiorum]|uniref:uncharacterized protein n=1 Tax=Penicillium macrosclerotiorum TaxID=303699 RepID=UPI0025485A84|nr:uncharacterized protein N7462_001921 [Penicillium macrosclerotiorum]KAJ5692498.1 hypothetical protein N7462_001921 [Penicillium macrosclerotiorum]
MSNPAYANGSGSIQGGIRYLHSLPGDCGIGSARYARISCSYNNAISWHNKKRKHVSARCDKLANEAHKVLKHWQFNCGGDCIKVAGAYKSTHGHWAISEHSSDC